MQSILIVGLIILFSYVGFLLLFFCGIRKLKQVVVEDNSAVPISVVVAIRNEQRNLPALLHSLAEQEYPTTTFEVIIVNDHSTDGGKEIVDNWNNWSGVIRWLDLPEDLTGKKSAVSYGIEHAANNIIVLTDADCTHPKGWLKAIVQQFANTELGMLIGPVLIAPNSGFLSGMEQLEHASLIASSMGACSMGMPFMASSANLSFRKDVINFHPSMLRPEIVSGDDVFLLHAAKANKIPIGCSISSEMLVLTQSAGSVASFFRQRKRWASKAKAYTDRMAIAVGFVVLLSNLLLALLLGLSFLNIEFFWFFIVGFLSKSIADFALLSIFLKKTKRLSLLWFFVPVQIIYPFYIIIAFILSLSSSTKWK